MNAIPITKLKRKSKTYFSELMKDMKELDCKNAQLAYLQRLTRELEGDIKRCEKKISRKMNQLMLKRKRRDSMFGSNSIFTRMLEFLLGFLLLVCIKLATRSQ